MGLKEQDFRQSASAAFRVRKIRCLSRIPQMLRICVRSLYTTVVYVYHVYNPVPASTSRNIFPGT